LVQTKFVDNSSIEPTILFLSFAALGIYQAAPSVTTGDAGEFAAAAATWGVPHAPGYPTWTIMAKALGTALAFGDWAYRANILSALCAAAALALLCDALRHWGAPRIARVGAVILLGFSPLWREQSAVAEVFAPLALAGAGLLWLVAAAGERLLAPGPSAALGLVFGLGLGAHQTLVLVLPALLLAGHGRQGRLLPALGWAAAGTVAGFGLHLTIPLRAVKSPPVDWGHVVSWSAFMRLLLRRDYGTFALTVEGANVFGRAEIFAQLMRFVRAVVESVSPGGALLAVLGALGWKRVALKLDWRLPAAWLIVAGPLFLVMGRPGFDAQTSGALQRFFLLPMLGILPFIAAGLTALHARAPALGALAAAVAASASLPGAAAASRRDDYLSYDYGRAILRELPRNAVFVMDGGDDTFYSMSFLVNASKLRPDIELRDRGGVVFPGGYGPDFRSLTRDQKEARRREVEARWEASGRLWYSTLNENVMPGRVLAPAGLLRRPLPSNAALDAGPALRETLALRWSRASAAAHYRDRALAAFFPYQRGLEAGARGDWSAAASWFELTALTAPDALWVVPTVSYALAVNGYRAVEQSDWQAAEQTYRAAAALEPGKAEPMTNLGVALERAGRTADAEAAYREAVRREPRAVRPWTALGARLWAAKRWAEAADVFSSAAALDPTDARSASFAAEARAKAMGKR
jgi:tetratricopeptide (TPR) repeat protein